VKELRDFIGVFFAELQDIYVYTQLANALAGSYRPKLLKATSLGPAVKNLIFLYLKPETGFSKQIKCKAFAYFVSHIKQGYEKISAANMREIMNLADSELKNEIATVTGNLQQMEVNRVLKLFSEVQDLDEEAMRLAAIFQANAVAAGMLPDTASLMKDIRLKKRICELLINCEQLLAFKNTGLPESRAFIAAYNDRHIHTVTHFLSKSQGLTNDLNTKAFDDRMLVTLETVVENKGTFEGFLREADFVSKLRQKAALDDLRVELDTLREIETVRYFVQNVYFTCGREESGE
jgi:hypothetical protein